LRDSAIVYFRKDVGDYGPLVRVLRVFPIAAAATTATASTWDSSLGDTDEGGPAQDVEPVSLLLVVFGETHQIDALQVRYVCLFASEGVSVRV